MEDPISLKRILNIKQCECYKKIIGSDDEWERCTNKSELYCLLHNQPLCGECRDSHNNSLGCKLVSYQDYANISFYIKFGEVINQFFKSNPHLNKNEIIKLIDRSNKFVYVNSNSNTIKIGQKFNNNGLVGQDPFLVVSFIGYSGSGKSCTVGSLCIESDSHPIPSYTNSESTSSDINSFIGETIFNNDEKRFKYLLLDTEGFAGLNPSVNNESDNSIIKEKDEYKSNLVEFGYPRLLYIISDIIVYTQNASGNRAKKDIIEKILITSEISSSNSNNLFKPHLIILLTKSEEVNVELCNLDNAKEDFFNNCSTHDINQLNQSYQSISVIYTSSINQNNGISKYIKETNTLNELISGKLFDSIQYKNDLNFNFNVQFNLKRIKKIINFIKQVPTGIPNLQLLNATGIKEIISIQKILRDHSSQDGSISNVQCKKTIEYFHFGYSLLQYFKYCYLESIKLGCTLIESYKMALDSLKSVLVKSYKKYQRENGLTDGSVDKEFRIFLSFLSDWVSESEPCEELINGKFSCINFKSSHPHHQSLETETKNSSFIKIALDEPKTYQAPYTSNGNHKSTVGKIDLCQYLEDRINEGELEKVSVTGPILNLEQAIKDCKLFCIGCMVNNPTIHYSCGHIVCLSCAKESKQGECIIDGCNGEILNKKDLDFNPAIGCRILSIDGGGCFISQCAALQIIKEELYDIEIYQLFDLIVGMNSGGFIGLCLLTTKSELNKVIELYTKFIKYKFCTISDVSLDALYKPVYESLELFERELGDTPFNECYSKTRLLIQSSKCIDQLNNNKDLEIEHGDGFVFSNYDDDDDNPSNKSNALVATISMVTLIDMDPVDAKLYSDNPSLYAIEEYKSLWGSSCKNIDTFISLGSVFYSTNDFIDYLFSTLKDLESNEILKDLESNKSILATDINIFRVDGIYSDDSDLDTIKKANDKANEIKSKYSTDKTLFNSINKSLSSLFYLSSLEHSNNILSGTIKCRLTSIPTQLADQLNGGYDGFYLQDDESSTSEFKVESKEITSSNISIQFIITNPPDIIDIRCSLVSKSRRINNTSISSCPFSITQDSDYLINNINNNQ